MGFIKEDTYRDGNGNQYKATNYGSTIVNGSGGGGAITLVGGTLAMLVFAIILGGPIVLLWFIFSGYKKFNSGTFFRIIASVLVLIFGFVYFNLLTMRNGWDYIEYFVVISYALTLFFFITVFIVDKINNKKWTSIYLAVIGGAFGLNNFYNKSYKIGILKLLLLSFSVSVIAKFWHFSFRVPLNVMLAIIGVLVFIGWIEAVVYLSKSSSRIGKVIKKLVIIILFLFFSITAFLGLTLYADNYKHTQQSTLSELVEYKTVTTKNFKSVYSSNYESALKIINDYQSSPLSSLSGPIFRHRSFNSIEVNRAIMKTYAEVPNYFVFESIIKHLGRVDKGYSKELAMLITDSMSKHTLGVLNANYGSDFNIEDVLKKNNQMSALRAYLKLKKKYKIK